MPYIIGEISTILENYGDVSCKLLLVCYDLIPNSNTLSQARNIF